MLGWIVILFAIACLGWLLTRTRSPVKWILTLVAAILLIPVLILWSLLFTETGLAIAKGQLVHLERFGVRIEGVSGRLAGPLRVERFELDHPRVHIVSHDIVVQPRIRELIIQTIGVRTLTARETLVEIRQAQLEPPTKPLRFLPRFLRINIDDARFDGVRYVHTNGTTVEASSVQGAATLTSRHIRVPNLVARGAWFELDGNLLLTAQRPLAVELAARGKLEHRDIEYAVQTALGGTIDELDIKASSSAPARADAQATFKRIDDRWRIDGKITSPELSLAPWLERPPFSLRAVALDVFVEPGLAIGANGELIVPEIDDRPLTIEARGGYADRVIRIDEAKLQPANLPAQLRAEASIALRDEAKPHVDARFAWTDLQWPLRGDPLVASATGSGTLRGALPYQFTVDAQIAGPRLPNAEGTANGTVSNTELTLAAFDIGTLGGRVSGNGTLSFERSRAWRLAATIADIDPSGLDERFPGSLSARLVANGTGFERKARFAVTVTGLRGRLRDQRLRGNGGVERTARGWKVREARIDYGRAQFALDGELDEQVHANWSIRAPALERLLPDAEGSLVFSGNAHGPVKSPHVVVEAQGERIGYRGWRAQTLTVKGDVDLGGERHSQLSIEAHQIGKDSPWLSRVRIAGEGTAEDHRLELDALGRAADVREEAPHAQFAMTGRYGDGLWTAKVASSEITTGEEDQRLTLAEPSTLVVAQDRVSLEPLCFAMGNGRFCAEGAWARGGEWNAMLSGYELPLAAFLPPAGRDAQFAGRIEGRIRLSGSRDAVWQGDAGMRIIDAAVIYRPPFGEPEVLNLGTGGLGARATAERIEFSFGVQAFTDTFLFANATIDRTATNVLMSSPLVGDFRARAADANILPLFFPEIDHAAGLLTAQGDVRGTLAQPQIEGRIELTNGEFDSYRVNLALRDLHLIANLAGNGLNFQGKGRAGEGDLSVSGTFAWHNGISRGHLQLRGQNLLVSDLPEYRVIASPDLNFEIDGRNIRASGTVEIPSARVQPVDLSGAVQISDDARYVGEHPAERDGRYIVSSDIRINMGDDVRVESFGLQGRIRGGVSTIVRTGETPLGRGELSVVEGRYEAYGQKLEITRGQLLFEGSPLADPGLDIEARRKIENVIVGLNVRGTLQQPRLSFFSEPTMPQTQIISYLLVGKPVDAMGTSEAATVGSATDALAVQGGGLLASQIGRRLGLEEVGVESTTDRDGEINQQLVLGKFLSPRLFVSYGISLTESINTLKLRYTISDRWVLKTEAGENQSADIEFNIER